jgi:cold shock CspA family protein/nitroreductase
MKRGTIKTVIAERGFGFIRTEAGTDLFFHRSACREVAFEALRPGQAVTYEEGSDPRGPRAAVIRPAGEWPEPGPGPARRERAPVERPPRVRPATYEPKLTPWQVREQDFPWQGSAAERLRFLVRYAMLAPSSHNTQPWRFGLREDEVRLFADTSRWLRVADADRRELYISVGCALENFLIAATYFGYGHEVEYFPDPEAPELVARIAVTPHDELAGEEPSPLFGAISARHTNHRAYEPRPVPDADLERLRTCTDEEGLWLHLTSDPEIKRRAHDLIVRADTLLFADPAFREELGYWIGQGAFGASWLLAKLGQWAVTYARGLGALAAKQDSEVLMSAPVLGLISSAADDRASQVQVGRVFERLCLTATSLGIRVQPMSQPLEVPALRMELRELIPVAGAWPQQAFRLGYADPEPHTPRRRLEEVLV